MKKIYFTFLVPIFLYSQNLEELVNLTIENRLVESSKQNLDAIKDEYKSVQRGYLPKLDAGASYSINEHDIMRFLVGSASSGKPDIQQTPVHRRQIKNLDRKSATASVGPSITSATMTVVNIDIVAHSTGDDSLKKKKKSKRQHNEVENGGLYVRILVCALNN